MTFEEWFEKEYPARTYGRQDPELLVMREEYERVWDAAKASETSRATVTLTYDQREDIIHAMQGVRLTDWGRDMQTGHPVEIRECSAADLLDCVLRHINEFAQGERRLQPMAYAGITYSFVRHEPTIYPAGPWSSAWRSGDKCEGETP